MPLIKSRGNEPVTKRLAFWVKTNELDQADDAAKTQGLQIIENGLGIHMGVEHTNQHAGFARVVAGSPTPGCEDRQTVHFTEAFVAVEKCVHALPARNEVIPYAPPRQSGSVDQQLVEAEFIRHDRLP
ncbi:hypothetical protein D3C71_1748070 [compost metagenome]